MSMRRLDLYGAIFVLWNLADRIKLRIREYVCCGFDIGKRNKYHPFLDASISSGGEFDGSPTGSHPHVLPWRDPKASQCRWMQARGRSRLELVEHVGAAGHGPSVPVFELAPGYQHQGILLVWHLGRGQHIGRHESRASALCWKAVPEDDRLTTGRIGDQAGPIPRAPRLDESLLWNPRDRPGTTPRPDYFSTG